MKTSTSFDHLFIVNLAVLFFISCKSNEEKSFPKISITVSDSIKIDYLGNLKLEGYDPQSDQYLLSNEGMMPILEVDSEGKITRNHQISHEGPDAIPQPGGLGYLNGDLLIYDIQAGYHKLNRDNSVTQEIQVPYPHSYLVFPPHLPLIKRTEDEVIYLKPLTDSDFVDGMGEAFFRNYYGKSLLEKLNLKTGNTTSHMEIPSESIYKDGMNHGIYIPIIKNKGNYWLLSTWFDPYIYVYEEHNGEFHLIKTVDLQLDDLVAYEAVSMKNSDSFYDKNADIRPGNINDILWLDDSIVVVYRKGLNKNSVNEIKRNYPAEANVEIEKQDPFYAAVLDKAFNLIDKDVEFPYGIHYPNVVNTTNDIVSLKHPALFDVEENYITLYKMKLQMD